MKQLKKLNKTIVKDAEKNAFSKTIAFYLILSLVLIFTVCTSRSQSLQNRSIKLVDISSQFKLEHSHLETTITVNPTNSDNIVVSSMISVRGNNVLYSVIYYSTDGGEKWKSGINLQTNSIEFPSGDPFLTSGSNGNLYFSTLHDGFTIWQSSDQGASWFVLNKVPGSSAYDREWVVADTNDSTEQRIYTSGKFDVPDLKSNVYPEAVAISRSVDAGETFTQPQIFLASAPNEALNSMKGMHLTKNGTLLVSYNRFYFDINTKRAIEGDGKVILGKISLLVSEDNAISFQEFLVSPIKAYGHSQEIKSMKTQGLGGMTSYTSSSEEIIYMTWIEATNGFGQTVVSTSRNGGKSWDKPIKVTDLQGSLSDCSNPAIAVNHEGVVLAAWNDRRNDPNNICFQVMGSFSYDKGQTFEKAFIIDEQITCPCRDSTGKANENCRFLGGGDTQGLTAFPDANFVLVFPSDRNGKMELILARIKPTQ